MSMDVVHSFGFECLLLMLTCDILFNTSKLPENRSDVESHTNKIKNHSKNTFDILYNQYTLAMSCKKGSKLNRQ